MKTKKKQSFQVFLLMLAIIFVIALALTGCLSLNNNSKDIIFTNIDENNKDIIFTNIDELGAWLVRQPTNTAMTPFIVKLNVGDMTGIRKILNAAPDKFVYLDFSDSTITTISANLFFGTASPYGCGTLVGITIPNSIISIEETSFNGCTNLSTITVVADNTAYTADNGILYNKDKTILLRYPEGKKDASYTIINSVTTIGNRAFEGTSLASITIPNSVISIGRYAFSRCMKLASITIPDKVTSIEEGVFFACISLTNVTIPNNVTSIGLGAFWGCTNLTNITIPNSVTSIGESAFNYCHRLTNVTIPNSVTSIGGRAFMDCTSLTSVTIPSSITSIGSRAFANCYLTKVTFQGKIPLTGFDRYAFANLGDLWDKFYATDKDNGTPGTYTTTHSALRSISVWTKQ